MDINIINKLIQQSKYKNNNNILQYFIIYKKNIKKIIIYIFIFLFLLKPSIPAKIIFNIIDAFKHEYLKSDVKYNKEKTKYINNGKY